MTTRAALALGMFGMFAVAAACSGDTDDAGDGSVDGTSNDGTSEAAPDGAPGDTAPDTAADTGTETADTAPDAGSDSVSDGGGDSAAEAPPDAACANMGKPCSPTNVCRKGAIGCEGGAEVCLETDPVADGTKCGDSAAGDYCGGGTCKSLGSCGGTGLCFSSPLAGEHGNAFVIQNYMDHDPSSGLKDYTGAIGAAAKTDNGHKGTDFHIGSFRTMDKGVAVMAAAAGKVIAAEDSFPDRHSVFPMGCSDVDNVIVLEHPNGWRTHYARLRQGSAKVDVGTFVDVGTVIAQVGSAGCSGYPHLHFEVRDKDDLVVDPFELGAWSAPAVYAIPLSYMESSVREGDITSTLQVQDPPADVTKIPPSGTVGLGLVLAGGKPGDEIKIVYQRPDGATYKETMTTLSSSPRQSLWYWNRIMGATTGAWKVIVMLNGAEARAHSITVGP